MVLGRDEHHLLLKRQSLENLDRRIDLIRPHMASSHAMVGDPKIVWGFLSRVCLRPRLPCGPAVLTGRKIKVKHEQLQTCWKPGRETGMHVSAHNNTVSLRINDTDRLLPRLMGSVLESFVASKAMSDQRHPTAHPTAPRV